MTSHNFAKGYIVRSRLHPVTTDHLWTGTTTLHPIFLYKVQQIEMMLGEITVTLCGDRALHAIVASIILSVDGYVNKSPCRQL
jgi:hypothetical protein